MQSLHIFAAYFAILWSAYFDKKLPRFSDMPSWRHLSCRLACNISCLSTFSPYPTFFYRWQHPYINYKMKFPLFKHNGKVVYIL